MINNYNRASLLFPSKKDGYDNFKLIQLKIKHLIKEEYRQDMLELTKKIVLHQDYLEIKKELASIDLHTVIKYNDILRNILDDENNNTNFLEILKEFKYLINSTGIVLSSLLHIRFDSNDILKNKEEIEYALNLYGYYLFQEDSPIINKLKELYNSRIGLLKDKTYLESIITKEMIRLEKEPYNMYKHYISKFMAQEKLIKNRVIEDHLTEHCLSIKKRGR